MKHGDFMIFQFANCSFKNILNVWRVTRKAGKNPVSFGKSWGPCHGYSILGWARHRPGELRERNNDLSTKKAKKGEHDWIRRVFQKDFCSDLEWLGHPRKKKSLLISMEVSMGKYLNQWWIFQLSMMTGGYPAPSAQDDGHKITHMWMVYTHIHP